MAAKAKLRLVKPESKTKRAPLHPAVCLPPDLHTRLTDFGAARGISVESLVRIAVSSLLRVSKFYSLDSQISFGKYVNETLETVIRLDPGYVVWARANMEGFAISDSAEVLLDAVLALSRQETGLNQRSA